MPIAPKVLSFLTTYRCTASCRDCCFGCSPTARGEIAEKRAHQFIEEAAAIPSLALVVFTGGECFLLGEKLDRLITHAARIGLGTRCVTNGYWAPSPALARRRVRTLAASGLREINFSTGDLHSRHTPVGHIRHASIASVEAGLTTAIMLELFKHSRFDLDAFIGNGRFRRLIEAGKIMLRTSPWAQFNGGAPIRYSRGFIRRNAGPGQNCRSIFETIGITPDERVTACCGLAVRQIRELDLGSLRTRRLKDILDGAQNDLVTTWIAAAGPRSIVEYARTRDARIGRCDECAHICDICRFVYTNRRLHQVLIRNPPPFADSVRSTFLMGKLLASLQGESGTARGRATGPGPAARRSDIENARRGFALMRN